MRDANPDRPETNNEAQLKASCSNRLKSAFRRLCNRRLITESEQLRALVERELKADKAR